MHKLEILELYPDTSPQILNLALLKVMQELFGLFYLYFLEVYFQFSALLSPGSVFMATLLCGESITVASAPDKRNVSLLNVGRLKGRLLGPH